MNLKNVYFPFCIAALVIFMSLELKKVQPDRPKTGFWAMEGTLLTHPIDDEADSLSWSEIFELQDHHGLTIWFSRYILKDVCVTGLCRMVKLWLFWDGAGNYLGIQMPEGETLTKSDHTDFEAFDYSKMDEILNDPNSILKDLESEDLTIDKEPENPFEIDGYTSATQPALAEVVVKDAVFTCHTLWHTVYGPTRTLIFDLLRPRIDQDYLALLFDSQKSEFLIWAIQNLENLPEYHEDFYPRVIECIISGHPLLSEQALVYFNHSRLADSLLQARLVEIMPQLTPQKKNDIIWKFVDFGDVSEEVMLKLLEFFQRQEIGVGSLNLIYRLLKPEHMKNNERIARIIRNLADHENAYVRNLTGRLINEKK